MAIATFTIKDDYTSAHDKPFNLPDALRKASKECGKNPLAIVRDWWSLSRGKGKLNLKEYFLYKLHDDNFHPKGSKERFISDKLCWPLAVKCGDTTWHAATEDKWLLESTLRQHDIPIVRTLAVIDRTHRHYGKTRKLEHSDEIRDFLKDEAIFPLFLKPIVGVASSGAMLIRGLENGLILLDQRSPINLEEFCQSLHNDDPYLIQELATNCDKFSTITPYLATIRCYNFLDENGLMVPFILLKIPSTNNIADNYWRPNNCLASINPTTGVIQRAVTNNETGTEEITTHPETNAQITGVSIPYWAEMLKLNKQCAHIYSPLKFTSTDIAITKDGPLIVEVNASGSPALPQIATGTGFLTDEIIMFFERHGWKFKK